MSKNEILRCAIVAILCENVYDFLLVTTLHVLLMLLLWFVSYSDGEENAKFTNWILSTNALGSLGKPRLSTPA